MSRIPVFVERSVRRGWDAVSEPCIFIASEEDCGTADSEGNCPDMQPLGATRQPHSLTQRTSAAHAPQKQTGHIKNEIDFGPNFVGSSNSSGFSVGCPVSVAVVSCCRGVVNSSGDCAQCCGGTRSLQSDGSGGPASVHLTPGLVSLTPSPATHRTHKRQCSQGITNQTYQYKKKMFETDDEKISSRNKKIVCSYKPEQNCLNTTATSDTQDILSAQQSGSILLCETCTQPPSSNQAVCTMVHESASSHKQIKSSVKRPDHRSGIPLFKNKKTVKDGSTESKARKCLQKDNTRSTSSAGKMFPRSDLPVATERQPLCAISTPSSQHGDNVNRNEAMPHSQEMNRPHSVKTTCVTACGKSRETRSPAGRRNLPRAPGPARTVRYGQRVDASPGDNTPASQPAAGGYECVCVCGHCTGNTLHPVDCTTRGNTL